MPAARVTSRRLSALKLRSSRSWSAAATIARRVASLRSSRVNVSRERDSLDRPERCVRELGVRLFTVCETYHNLPKTIDGSRAEGAPYTHLPPNFEAAPPGQRAALIPRRPTRRPARRRSVHRTRRADLDDR